VSASDWGLLYASGARKDLRRLDPPIRKRVVTDLERLARQGSEGNALTKLKGRTGSKLRVGDWRVILELDRATRTIRVKRVLPRGRAYQR
jgi:mRNA interferase RelE/StbE